MLVDKNGFLLAVMVSVANIHDSKATELLMKTLAYLFIPVKIILADGGYRGEIIEQVKNKFGYLIQVVMRKDEKKSAFKPISKRWIIERSFAWLDNDRRLAETMNSLWKIPKIWSNYPP